ncbi:SERTA domain-containing protein [Trichonephila clavata]|uniref:SERTA domain-containing protein n=1 Tax=Trichonephila clavata TaxID=2740835 RepID=A0A8X6IVE2_TRICU|nr:SERTA domain-containing protein [Trichonephila clavata]
MDIEDSPRATPFVRTAYDRVEPVALWTEDHDRLPSLNWSSVLKTSSSSSPNANSLSGNTSPASGSSPSSSEDEIFGDVDLTLYDYDYTPLSPPNVAMAPLTAEELMWSLSNNPKPANSDDRDYLASVHT